MLMLMLMLMLLKDRDEKEYWKFEEQPNQLEDSGSFENVDF
jgi:hypothetical protein